MCAWGGLDTGWLQFRQELSKQVGSQLSGCKPSKARITQAYLWSAKMYNRNPAPAHMVHSFSEMRLWFLARGCRSEVREPIVLVSWRHLINPPVFRSTCFSCASYFGISAFLFKQALFYSSRLICFISPFLQPPHSPFHLSIHSYLSLSQKLLENLQALMNLWFSLLHGPVSLWASMLLFWWSLREHGCSGIYLLPSRTTLKNFNQTTSI